MHVYPLGLLAQVLSSGAGGQMSVRVRVRQFWISFSVGSAGMAPVRVVAREPAALA